MERDQTLESELLSAVDDGFDAQVKLTEKLVRFASLRGREHAAQDFLFQEMRERGYTMDRWAIDVDEIADHPGFSPVTIDYAVAYVPERAS